MSFPEISSSNLAQKFKNDLYQAYADLRELDNPIRLLFETSGVHSSVLCFSRYEHVKFLLSAQASMSKDVSLVGSAISPNPLFSQSMLFKDEPEHQFLRQIFADSFKKIAVSRWLKLTSFCVADLLARHRLNLKSSKSTSLSVVDDVASQLPLLLVMKIIGVPEYGIQNILQLSSSVKAGSDSFQSTILNQKEKFSAYGQILDAIREGLFSWSLDHESLLGRVKHLLDMQDLSIDVAIENIALLLFAGHETTSALISSVLMCLAQNPNQLSLLRDNQGLIKSAVEEALRYESPLQRATFRSTNRALNVDGIHISKGEEVYLLIGAANRDSSVFERAEFYELSRRPNPHLSFGLGSYHCLGRHLAVMEAQVVCQMCLEFFPGEWNIRELRWGDHSFLRHLETLVIQMQ